jgi:hypothetical protein
MHLHHLEYDDSFEVKLHIVLCYNCHKQPYVINDLLFSLCLANHIDDLADVFLSR